MKYPDYTKINDVISDEICDVYERLYYILQNLKRCIDLN